MKKPSLFAELRRRNVIRASVLYIGGVWALAQGIAQLLPAFGVADWVVRWFVVAGVLGFPFWVAFAWYFEFTPEGLKRESDIEPGDSIAHQTGRKLDFWIIGVLAVVVVVLLTNTFVWHKGTQPEGGADLAKVPDKSIAVLPLANESDEKDEQYFSDGLSEDLITALSQFSQLKVISRNSAFQFRDSKESSARIGAKLGVAHLLEGSVRRVGDQVRIYAQLVEAADGRTVWSRRFDRPYKDLFALQDEVTTAVAAALKTQLLHASGSAIQNDRPPSGNLAAYNAYLQGNFRAARNAEPDLRQAIASYQQAIALDPRYAEAQARLSIALTSLGVQFLSGIEQEKVYAQARAAADAALSLDPDLAQGHTASGILLLNARFDLAGAEQAIRRALLLAPNDAAATFQLGKLEGTQGRLPQAVQLIRQALKTDPLHAAWYNWMAIYLAAQGQLDAADAMVRKAIDLQPTAVNFHVQQAIIAILRGDAAAALAAAQLEPETSGWHDIGLALALQAGRDHAAANHALKRLVDTQADDSPTQIAEIYALRKQPEQMFHWLNRALLMHDPGLANMLADPFFFPYAADPRFAGICRKVGLPPPPAPAAAPRTGNPPRRGQSPSP